jgi:hypothetical protein
MKTSNQPRWHRGMYLAIIVLAAVVAALAAGMAFLMAGATATTVLSVGGVSFVAVAGLGISGWKFVESG